MSSGYILQSRWLRSTWFHRTFFRVNGRMTHFQELQVIFPERVYSSRDGLRYWEVPSALSERTPGLSGLRELSSRSPATGCFRNASVRYIRSSGPLTLP